MSRIKNWASALISSLLIVVGFIYTARGLTDLYEKDTSLIKLIAEGGFATAIGFLVAVLLIELAISNTLASNSIEKIKEGKGEVLFKITPSMGKGHTFCKKRNELKRSVRIEGVIRKYFITLEDYEKYKKSGGLSNKDIPFLQKISLWRMERKLKKANYDDYDFDEIINGVEKPKTKREKRETLSGFRLKKYSSKLLTSAMFGLVFGYFGFKLADDPNWGMVIYLALQFITFVANGVTQYFFTKSYILNEYRDQIKEDTNFLWEFHSSLTLNPEWYIKPSEEEIITEDKQPMTNEIKDESLTEAKSDIDTSLNPYYKNEPLGI